MERSQQWIYINLFMEKSKKTLPLLNHPELKNDVPMTDWYSEQKAGEMISKYSSLFIKPDVGRIGSGIIRLRKLGNSHYDVHYEDQAESFETIDQALMGLREKLKSSKKYLIQQGIELATVLDRPFDFRIVMHKTNGEWKDPHGVQKFHLLNWLLPIMLKEVSL